ncbi:tyrosine-type recombinase/integrase [Mesorhizobium sp. ZC-5]|uniref:tyrosine-type recombinase/integrase n=1 Tax=Mesorhizobium sp. ZC-5 TaxID=2986066 RepID=UPI0021E87336|nr:tyrosine-type recombinase/integrase [Mesorhizobium sp. ZC-5]MCV3243924.1 tyrosine-type recombinase/integrase [Mesorhizobium sp. ZC-5]
MVTLELKGLHKVKAKGRIYWYAWRGGPRLAGEPGTPEFLGSYNEAIANRRSSDTGRFLSVISLYRASTDYQKLAASTKKNWGPWLDRIADHFGELRTAQFDRPERIRPIIRRWRAAYAETPRAADYGMQVLSRVCSYAVDPVGKLASNPCEGIKHLYSADRSEIIWTDADIDRFKQVCSTEIAFAIDLASHTGLRLSDLAKLSWSHVGDDAIMIRTGKRSGKAKVQREAVIPLYDELRELLERIPRRSPVILTNSLKRPWSKDGLSSRVAELKEEAWPEGVDLHFHDLRGTAATKFYLAGLSVREIAEIMAWEEEHVERIIRRYVSRTAAIKERIRKLNEART